MRKITATGYEETIPEDRPTAYISGGAGNHAGVPEIHIHLYDPAEDMMVQAWFPRDAILAAVLHPEDERVVEAVLDYYEPEQESVIVYAPEEPTA